jgi:hypothetical protein
MPLLRTSTRAFGTGLRIPAFALLVSGCAVAKTAGDDGMLGGQSAYFVDLKSGDSVHSPVEVKLGVKGMTVQASGATDANTGHFDVFIDKGPLAKGEAVPIDSKHIHLTKGEKAVKLPLELGKHQITVQFADGKDVSYGPSMSQSINITVLAGSGDGDVGGDGDVSHGDGDVSHGDGDVSTGDGDVSTGDGDTGGMDAGTAGDGDTTPGDGDTTPGDGDTTPGDGDTTPGDGDTTGGNCSGVPAFAKGTTYKAGDKVQVSSHLYQCMSGAQAGWCSLGTYEPGTGTNWAMAWNDLGGC